jgi:hypothetical protein
MKNRKMIASFFLLLLLPYYSFSTCIVILLKGNTFYVAADTLEVKSVDDTVVGSNRIRKINAKDNIYFAIAGHQDSVLKATALSSIKPNKLVDSIAASFSDQMRSFYNIEMLALKRAAPKKYQYYLRITLSDVVFFGFRHDKPFLWEVSFQLTEVNGNTNVMPTIQNLTNLPATSLRPTTALGFWDHLRSLQQSDFNDYFAKAKNSYPDYLSLLVKLEVDNHKDTVGCPIDRLVLSPSKKPVWSRWDCR